VKGSALPFSLFQSVSLISTDGLAASIFAPKNFQNDGETGLTRDCRRHHSWGVRSKYFKKNEKKACQPSKTSLILTAKPNQTNGETNDKKRTAHVRILPLGSRSRRRTSFPHRRQRLRAGTGPGAKCTRTGEY
jgi:hypothetical protein